MRFTDFWAIALAYVAIVSLGGAPAKPSGAAISSPTSEARQAVAPVTTVLAGHREEARQLAAFYHSAADTLRRDGAGARVLTNTGDLRTFCQRAATLRFQGAFQKVPGLSDRIHGPDGALGRLLKLDIAELDHGKAADALDAVAWACQEASR